MRTFAERLGLDPVLDVQALEALTRPDPETDARARLRGLLAVLTRIGLELPPGLEPGEPSGRLTAGADVWPEAERIAWTGWREAVKVEFEAVESSRMGPWMRGPRARALAGAQLAAGLPIAVWGAGRLQRRVGLRRSAADDPRRARARVRPDQGRGAGQALNAPGRSVVVLVLVVQPGQPRGEALDRHLEVGVQIDERTELLGEPLESDLFLASPLLQLLDTAVGEVHGASLSPGDSPAVAGGRPGVGRAAARRRQGGTAENRPAVLRRHGACASHRPPTAVNLRGVGERGCHG